MWLELALAALLGFFWLYHYTTKQFNHFKDKGVPYLKGTFPLGSDNSWKSFTGKVSLLDIDTGAAEALPNEKVVGYFMMGQPIYVINDEELAKQILIKDFDYFMDRRVFDSKEKYFDSFLTNLKGTEWKRMRALMSGVFTSGRLKVMTKYIAEDVGANFENYIADCASKGIEVESKDAGGKMTLDSIATAGFGIQTNSFDNPKNHFRVQALTLVGHPDYQSKMAIPKAILMSIWPALGKLLGWTFMPAKPVAYFADIIKQVFEQRKISTVKRNDFIDLIVEELKKANKGSTEEKTYEDDFERDAAMDTTGLSLDTGKDELELIVSNVLLFFFAGFETTSIGFSVVCHKLALFPELQDRVIDEIDKVIGDDDITYDKIQNLKYMDMFIAEAFRIANVVPAAERRCTKDYRIPGTDFTIPKDRYVKITVTDMSLSEDNFKNPKEFDPDNYLPQNNPSKFATMSFGQGPRNCIGMRYALLTLKIGLVYMLKQHRVVRSENTPDKIEKGISDLNNFKNKVYVKFEAR